MGKVSNGAKGKVYLVGAGPGAPDLLTLRAARLLGRADIVFHDALVHPDTIALATSAELVPVGKRCGAHSTAQRFINKRLVDAAARHAVVVRLKGGDPMLFGRAQEEIDALDAAGIDYEVVPGVTAALAASAQLGTSLTQRGVARTLAFVTPRIGDEYDGDADGGWVAAVMGADTAAIYMGSGQAAAIASQLIASGKPANTPVVVVRDASLPHASARKGTLEQLPALVAATVRSGAGQSMGETSQTHGPAVILLGEALANARCASLELDKDQSSGQDRVRRVAVSG